MPACTGSGLFEIHRPNIAIVYTIFVHPHPIERNKYPAESRKKAIKVMAGSELSNINCFLLLNCSYIAVTANFHSLPSTGSWIETIAFQVKSPRRKANIFVFEIIGPLKHVKLFAKALRALELMNP